MYDKNNIFARMIRGEIPVEKIVENEHAFSFRDIAPVCRDHILTIPKGEYENILDFARNASTAEQAAFWKCFADTADALGIAADFNAHANAGLNGPWVAQSVFHFHLHLFAGPRTSYFDKVIGEIRGNG